MQSRKATNLLKTAIPRHQVAESDSRYGDDSEVGPINDRPVLPCAKQVGSHYHIARYHQHHNGDRDASVFGVLEVAINLPNLLVRIRVVV